MHNIIAKNLSTIVLPFLKGKGCDMFGSDLRAHIPENSFYTYPDFTIICGEWQTTDSEKDTVTNPSVIVEILSKSTRDYDRGGKFHLYRSINTLREVILIDRISVCIEIYSRQTDNSWQLTEFNHLTQYFTIKTI